MLLFPTLPRLSPGVLSLLACMLVACTETDDRDELRARRARQMRDVSRMLDAMETQENARRPVDATRTPAPGAPASRPSAETSGRTDAPASWIVSCLATFGSGVAAIAIRRWRRKRRLRPLSQPLSIAAHFSDSPIVRRTDAQGIPSHPTWVYRTSPFETPLLYMVPESVDLLPLPSPDIAISFAIRSALGDVECLTGARRLFAVRELVARYSGENEPRDRAGIHALIDVHLAWASWVRGDALKARLAEVERLCHAMTASGSGQPDPSISLLIARTALARARLLSGNDARDVCSLALLHAFLAEQEPSLTDQAAACRQEITAFYESIRESTPSLPGEPSS
ncbi:hypothetical protein [Dyella sp. 333MFSha]|uniref:hypothetical protein n=1 Tax=Dyella sp. 333MFSha TaxID=1798240 RepID=UPI00088CFCAA|nr:hypothetical protein [Dyella sp. 333MFSha]SDF67404.1 hypothetical protein SAMN04515659_1519 [Dyella sp. 333MFSha]